jgi:hypothetical protein
MNSSGSRRITGIRNFRQALASPYPVLSFPDSARPHIPRVFQVTRLGLYAFIAALVAVSSGCALSLRTPTVAELERHPGRYQDHTVSIDGIVTSSWGLPLLPFRLYKVDDGTGEVTVVSQNSRTPARGERVRVKGKVSDVAVLGGQALGLHLREEGLYVKRR